jgi:hypothetical protein
MQALDTNLLNSLLQVGEPQAQTENMLNLNSDVASSEFASLLGEAQQLSKENIDPKILLSSLEDESINLIPEEKEILKEVLLGKTSNKEIEQFFKDLASQEAKLTQGHAEESVTKEVNSKAKEKSIFTITDSAKNADLAKNIENGKEVKNVHSIFTVQKSKVPEAAKSEAINIQQTDSKLANETILEKPVSNRMKNAQFLSAALPATNKATAVKNAKPDLKLIHTSTEDFVNTSAKVKDPKSSVALKMLTNDLSMKGQIAAYGQEKNILDNNIIKINNSQNSNSVVNEAIQQKSDLVQNEFAVDQISAAQLNVDGGNKNSQMVKVAVTTPVLDLSGTPAGNTEQLISKISDYVQQTSFNNRDSLDLVVKHNELGQFNINVNKMKGENSLNVQIQTASTEAHKFFTENEVDLVKSLNQAGIKLGDIKLSSSDSANTGSDQKQSSDESTFTKSQQSGKQDQREDTDSRRRKELWEEYKYQMGA